MVYKECSKLTKVLLAHRRPNTNELLPLSFPLPTPPARHPPASQPQDAAVDIHPRSRATSNRARPCSTVSESPLFPPGAASKHTLDGKNHDRTLHDGSACNGPHLRDGGGSAGGFIMQTCGSMQVSSNHPYHCIDSPPMFFLRIIFCLLRAMTDALDPEQQQPTARIGSYYVPRPAHC